MKIDDNLLNSEIEYCIDEYVRLIEHRQMLREKWFEGKTLEQIAEDHKLSVPRVKEIIYKQGDRVLLIASKKYPNTI